MTLGTNSTRVGQATEPGSLLQDAAIVSYAEQQTSRYEREAAKSRNRERRRRLGLHAILTGLAVLLSLPFVYMVMTSLKPFDELSDPSWIPKDPDSRVVERIPGIEVPLIGTQIGPFDLPDWTEQERTLLIDGEEQTLTERGVPVPANYYNVFDVNNPDINNRGVPLLTYFRNSLFVAAWVTFLQVLTSSLAAFSFARLKWPGRDKVFLLYLSTMMLPGLVMMIPNYQIMIQLGLVDTLPGLIIPAAFSAFGTFLLRQFMLTIPSSLDEAAEIDGAGKFRLFWDIILPLSRPGLVTLTIFTFMGNYNSFFWPLVMVRTQERYTLPIGLLFFDSTRGQQTHLMMAAVLLSIVPMILVFVLLQKQLVKGIQLGAVKG
ncbi:MAG: carbohydrate ABC transporter permease [Planctomycetota bacterium]